MADRRLLAWPHRHDRKMLEHMSSGTFTFLNETRDLGVSVGQVAETSRDRLTDGNSTQVPLKLNWHPEAPRLWRFHLHYHEALLELASLVSVDAAWAIIDSWLSNPKNQTPHSDPDAWHPFCISQRLPIWLMLASQYGVPDGLRKRFFQSVLAQVQWLWTHLEWDLGGNHLLENLRALAIANMALEGDLPLDARRLSKWIDIELKKQVLPSGEHFERTPTYHAIMTLAVMEIADAVDGSVAAGDLAEKSCSAANRMREFHGTILHPDGQIPLLGDSVFGETPHVGEVAETSQLKSSELSSSSATFEPDYWTWWSDNRKDFLLFDVGAVACDHLPAHGHADLFGLEASIGGERFLVDTGTYDYDDSPERQASRSTLSHNTLAIDGEDQCDVWSRFRMGRRGHVLWKRAGKSETSRWCMAAHDAYRFLGIGETIRTAIVIDDSSLETTWLIVDWFTGPGHHDLISTLQLEPNWKATIQTSGEVICENAELEPQPRIRMLTEGELSIEPGVYCPDFGVALPNESIVAAAIRFEREPVAWQICPGGCELNLSIRLSNNELIVESVDDKGEILRVPILS
ncbi:heparinase II/III family protein [Novipirellula artificiosorum]|uniref:Heparinase II/III-like protein n=1 Tax=Novipirellula artificiosorum TaxID=2528016 RepID=A0A5C6D910_9BACT|nr:heparinase II/III family protein [Novipirellula artificiosorum]TWU32615.1 Heparinase II/III-like protein [Novipirellula artificiosorum]